jgi:hypothetical protein
MEDLLHEGMSMPTKSISTAEVLDRVLDKGIVVDGWLVVSVAGLDLIAVEGRVVVASLTTYTKRARTVDRALGRRRARPAAKLNRRESAATSPLAKCPRCRARGKDARIMLVTVQAGGETRVTAQCPACRWQRTEAA